MLKILVILFFALSGASAHAVTVLCLGDSLTAGYEAPDGQSYVDFLRKDLARDGYHATLINQGYVGATTKDGLTKIPTALAVHPSIVILEFGGNDLLRGLPPATVKANLSSMIQKFQLNHIRVLIAGMEAPPNLGRGYTEEFGAIYPALAAQYHVPLIPFILQGIYGVDGLMSPDNTHPNARGYEKMASLVKPHLEKMLKK